LEHIGKRFLGKPFQILRIQYEIGNRLSPGQTSRTGMYAILSGRNSRILRATLCKEVAEFMADGEDRFLAELRVIPKTESGTQHKSNGDGSRTSVL
jgi:hypothetical protein